MASQLKGGSVLAATVVLSLLFQNGFCYAFDWQYLDAQQPLKDQMAGLEDTFASTLEHQEIRLVHTMDSGKVEIYFDRRRYAVSPAGELLTPIRVHYNGAGGPFTIILRQTSIREAERKGTLNNFIDFSDIEARAIPEKDFLEETDRFQIFPSATGVSPNLTPRFNFLGCSSGGPPKSLAILATLSYSTPRDQVCFKASASDTTCHQQAAVVIDITERDATVEFEHAVYSVSEDDGSVDICAQVNRITAGSDAIEIRLSTEDDTAKAGEQYTRQDMTYRITSSQRICLKVPIIDDFTPDMTTQFRVKAICTTHRINEAATTVTISDDETKHGCTSDLLKAIAAKEAARKKVVRDMSAVIPSLSAIDITSLETAYAGIAKKFKEDATKDGLSNFTEAVTRITDAKKAECRGHGTADIISLGREFKELSRNVVENVDKLREIVGKMLCLVEKGRRIKRQDTPCPDSITRCTCPTVVRCSCEFFACIDRGDTLKPVLGIHLLDTGVGNPCLGFVVDTTSSMRAEIESAKTVVKQYIMSEEAGPQCYVLQPFNDLVNGVFDPRSIPSATIAITYEPDVAGTGLTQLENAVNALHTFSGGDLDERQFRALRTVLNLRDSSGVEVLVPGSELVLLTDAKSHDAELEGTIISLARRKKVCITIYLSGITWAPYNNIVKQTGGVLINNIDRNSFNNFIAEHDFGQCGRFYDIPTKQLDTGSRMRVAMIASFDTAQRCHRFTTTPLSGTLTVTANSSQIEFDITKPDSEVVHVITNYKGEKVYRDRNPLAGSWTACVKTGTLTISVDIEEKISSTLQYVTGTGSSLSLQQTPPPQACTEGLVVIEIPQLSSIKTAFLHLIDDKSGRNLETTALHRCGDRLVGKPKFPIATVDYRAVGTDNHGNRFDATLSKTTTFTSDGGTTCGGTSTCTCMNGGTCIPRVIHGTTYVRCACQDGYTGLRCEQRYSF